MAMLLLCLIGGTAQTRTNSTSTSVPKGIKIWLIDNSTGQYRPYGCGCSFWPVGKRPKLDEPATHKYILIGNHNKQAWVNIEGEIVKMRLVKDTTKYKGSKGNRFYQTYKSDVITVIVECVARGFGDTHAVYCDSTITVIKGVQKQTVKAEGDCGC
jgi:hypothetical protein